ncbi:MAG: aminotransferase class I/II-fold pyridoxal phosphate-dependent enzyme, partial [Exiguobacterium chiriqhucha]
ILNSPSNPTGMIYTEAELSALADVIKRHDLLVVSDEIYEKLVYGDAEFVSIATLPGMLERTIIINGVSKSHAMTGWRIGYAVGDKTIIEAMTNLASHSTSNPTSIAQAAAVEAYNGPQDDVEMMRVSFAERLEIVYERLIAIPGITCLKPQGAFYLYANAKEAASMSGYDSVDAWCEAVLGEAFVALVPGSGFGQDDYVRLSYATELKRVLEALDRVEDFITRNAR